VTTVRRSATRWLAGVALSGAAAGVGVAGAGPAAAAERVVQISRDGVQPQLLQVEPGDTVRFVNEDPTFAYRAQSTGGPWRFDSGPTALLEGDFVVPSALTRPGSYGYRVAQDAPFAGTVVVAGTVPAASPTPAPSAVPASPPPPPAVSASPSTAVAPAVAGPLPGLPRDRRLGLAVTAGAVLLLGAASLLLRLLLSLRAGQPGLSDARARV
jgi:plastocyanin